MRCDRVSNMLMDYVDGELQEKLCAQVREHLAECRVCRAELETARKASNLLMLLGQQEEPRGIIRMPAVTKEHDMTWQRRAWLQPVGALLIAVIICIAGSGVLHSVKRTPSAVQMEPTARTASEPDVQTNLYLPKQISNEQQPIKTHTDTAQRHPIRAQQPYICRQHKPHIASKSPHRPQGTDGRLTIASEVQPAQVTAEISPSNMMAAEGLSEGDSMLVAVTWPSLREVVNDSYSYHYTDYDPKTGESTECYVSKRGDSVEIQLRCTADGEQGKGEATR